jgi:hypothetical protein
MAALRLDWGNWLYGLIAGFVGGGAGSVITALGAIGITPNSYNLNTQFGNTMRLAAFSFLINGFITMMAYLHQNPLPAKEPTTTVVETTVGPSKTPQTTTTIVTTGAGEQPK